MDLKVGDIIQVMRNQIVPADILILDTDILVNGDCIGYVDNSMVDGRIAL